MGLLDVVEEALALGFVDGVDLASALLAVDDDARDGGNKEEGSNHRHRHVNGNWGGDG